MLACLWMEWWKSRETWINIAYEDPLRNLVGESVGFISWLTFLRSCVTWTCSQLMAKQPRLKLDYTKSKSSPQGLLQGSPGAVALQKTPPKIGPTTKGPQVRKPVKFAQFHSNVYRKKTITSTTIKISAARTLNTRARLPLMLCKNLEVVSVSVSVSVKVCGLFEFKSCGWVWHLLYQLGLRVIYMRSCLGYIEVDPLQLLSLFDHHIGELLEYPLKLYRDRFDCLHRMQPFGVGVAGGLLLQQERRLLLLLLWIHAPSVSASQLRCINRTTLSIDNKT